MFTGFVLSATGFWAQCIDVPPNYPADTCRMLTQSDFNKSENKSKATGDNAPDKKIKIKKILWQLNDKFSASHQTATWVWLEIIAVYFHLLLVIHHLATIPSRDVPLTYVERGENKESPGHQSCNSFGYACEEIICLTVTLYQNSFCTRLAVLQIFFATIFTIAWYLN